MNVTLKNAHLFDPSQRLNEKGSVVVEGGKIIDVLKGKNADTGQVVDLKGQHLMAGFVDLHVHLREPGQEHKETIGTGTRAAAAGASRQFVACPIRRRSMIQVL